MPQLRSLPFWPKIHRVAVQYRPTIDGFFVMAYATVLLLMPVAWFTFSFALGEYGKMLEVGSKMGVVALVLYLATLLPGIAKRLDIFPLERTTLMLFRRQLGILMFLTAYAHGAVTATIPLAMTVGLKPEFFTTHEQLGMLALIVLFPLWLTSNDFSVKKLGRFWNTLHRLTYLALFLIFLHVLLATELSWTVIGGAVLVLEIWSWIVHFQNKARLAKQATV